MIITAVYTMRIHHICLNHTGKTEYFEKANTGQTILSALCLLNHIRKFVLAVRMRNRKNTEKLDNVCTI